MNPEESQQGNKSDSETPEIKSRSPRLIIDSDSLESQLAESQLANDISLVTQKLVTQEDAKYSAAERAKFKATIASRLAISIWIIIGIIVIIHIGTVAWLWVFPPSWVDSTKDAVEQLERASKSIDEIAKTLYTFLGTLATAITGYYFNESAAQRDNDSER